MCTFTHSPLDPPLQVCNVTHNKGAVMNSRDIIAKLEAAGWRQVSQKGSHVSFKCDGNPNIVTVPHPRKDMPIGTLKSIERASGLKLR